MNLKNENSYKLQFEKKTDPKEIKDVQKENFMLDSKRIPTLFSEMWT